MNASILIAFLLGWGGLFTLEEAKAQSPSELPRQAMLGAMLRDVSFQEAQSLGLKATHGAFVEAVLPNGPAERAGLRPGDVIVAVDRRTIVAGSQLVQIIGQRSPGDVIELVLLRSGKQQVLSAKLSPIAEAATPEASPGTRPVEQSAKAPSAKGKTGSAQAVRFTPFVVRDPQLNNIEALRFLIPADWQVQGGIVWRHDRAILATTDLRVFNPKSMEAVHFLPLEQFAQGNPGYGFGIGSNYLGSELQPAMDPRTFVTRIVLPRYRRGIAGATLVGGGDLSAVAQEAQVPGTDSQTRAGRFRFAYTQAGRPMEEDIYCVLSYTAVPAIQTIYWSPVSLYSLRAEKGQLDQQTKLMQVIPSSVKTNLQWFNAYLQVWEMWKSNVMQSIQNAGYLSRYIAGINNEITAMNRQAWEQQQAAQDRISRRFSEYIRGVDTYQNPITNQPIQLPGGYRQAWTNASGEYIVSDSAGYNPNVGSRVQWQPMQRIP